MRHFEKSREKLETQSLPQEKGVVEKRKKRRGGAEVNRLSTPFSTFLTPRPAKNIEQEISTQ